jgi:hypothetical protein
MFRLSVVLLVAFTATAIAQPKLSREDRVKLDRKKVEAEGFWIYNDLAKGYEEAKKTGKPMLVALRCVPCEECVKLDDELVDRDPVVRPLLEKFVCVRIVSTNGLDLSLFQFDTDQSFAAFMFNVDGTIYGRFGTRSHRTNWLTDVSLEGMAKALQGALDLHANYPKNKDQLASKRGPAPLYESPEKFPTLKGKYGSTLATTGNVVQSCIHCHQIGDAVKDHYRKKREPIPDSVLFPYPHPKSIGLILDPKEAATVQKVEAESIAAKAGIAAGDEIVVLGRQPMLSMADVQWVLHNVPGEGGKVQASVKRGGKTTDVTLELPAGWRRNDDITWRTSTWGLRRMATGGILFESVSDADRGTVLRAKHVGAYGPHAAAKNAGFQQGDVIVEWDGKSFTREVDVLVHGLTERKPGDKIPVIVLRGGKKLNLTLPMQE